MKVPEFLNSARVRKILAGAVLLFLLVGLLGFLVAPHFLRPFLENALSEKLHRPVKVAELAINPYAMSATIRGLSVGQREGGGELAGFDELYVNLEASSLFHWAPVVNQLRLTAPRVHLVRNGDKTYNVSDLIEDFLKKPDEPASHFALYNIQVNGGRFLFEDRPEKKRHEVTGLELGIPFISNLPSQVEIFVQPSLAAKVNGSAFSLGGKARLFAATREASVDLALGDLDLTPYLDYLPLALNFSLPSARLDTKLKLAFIQPAGKPAGLVISGDVTLRKLLVQGRDGHPILDLPAAKLVLKSLDVMAGKADLEALSLDSPTLRVVRQKDGSLSLARLVSAAPAVAAAKSPGKAVGAPAGGNPFSLSLGRFRISNGSLSLGDESAAQPATLSVSGLEVNVERLALVGGEIRGTSGLDLALKSLSVQARGEKQPAFSLGAVHVAGQADGDKHALMLTEVRAEGGRLVAVREADRTLSLERLLPRAPAPAGKRAAPAEASSQGWSVTVAKLALDGWGARFEDKSVPNSVPLLAEPIKLSAENLTTARGGTPRLSLKVGLGKKGHLDVGGTLALSPLAGKFEVDVKGLDLVPLQGYLSDGFNVTVAKGALEGKGSLSFEQPGTATAMKAGFKGSLGLADLGLIDKGNASDLLKWKMLRFTGVNAGLGGQVPFDLSLSEISLKDFYARLVVNADGTLALRNLVKGEGHPGGESAQPSTPPAVSAPATAPVTAAMPPPASAQAAASAAGKSPAYRIRVNKVTLAGGRVRFSDLFIKPNYTANLTGLSGSVTGLASVPGSTAAVDIAGTVDDVAPLTIVGKVNPLDKDIFLDLTADAKGIEMSGFSPYAARYAGYDIEKGKLSANIHYFIENRQLRADNHLFLDQLTFGKRVESPQATHLPVLLAVALLKNGRGEIDINLPISGSLDDPQFSVGGIVFKMFMNLIVKAVTSPFALIGSLFGGGEELAWLEFTSGQAVIPPAGAEKLQNLAKALKDRPGLKLEVAGRADAGADTEGYKRALLERKVKAQKLKETVKKGEESGSVDEVTVSKEEWPKYLTLAYKDESFAKPKNMIWLPKSLPPEEMEKLMLANMAVSEDALRRLAERRGKAVEEWMVKTAGIPAERVFMLAPKLGADVPKSGDQSASAKPKASLSRVDFTLK
ncbi:MAG: DUF748 domain-containing protein [Rhodocyclaceae bacterium]|nr:DUF748 domain-containing protein [Rhodocyclaceae bacterium]